MILQQIIIITAVGHVKRNGSHHSKCGVRGKEVLSEPTVSGNAIFFSFLCVFFFFLSPH